MQAMLRGARMNDKPPVMLSEGAPRRSRNISARPRLLTGGGKPRSPDKLGMTARLSRCVRCRQLAQGAVLSLLLLTAGAAHGNTFTVVNSGASDYVINGANDPALTLYRGRTYTFNISTPGHPFWIKTNQTTGTGGAYSSGMTGNGMETGALVFAVPTNAPNTLFYNCQFHASMTGVLSIENSPQKGWWRFETVGAPVPDVSGHGLDGTVTNMNSGDDDGISGFSTDVPGTQVVDGNLTNANARSLRFTKGLGMVRILDPARFAIAGTQVTVEAFVKITSTNFPMRIINIANTTSPPPATLISPHLSAFDPRPLMALTIHSDNTTLFHTGFAQSYPDPSPLALRHWHHVAFVQDGQISRFYVDYQPLGDWNGFSYTPGPFTGVNAISLGGIAEQVGNTFEGLLDEIRVTDQALIPTQFLRVAGGLAPGIRAMPSAEFPSVLTAITETGMTYRIQGSTNLLAAPQVWTNIGSAFAGQPFYTTVTNPGAPAAFYRVIRNP